MKNVLIASGIAIFAIASIAGAQSYTFNTNLTVGSTGADVVALQTWLMANGYSIPSVASGAAAKGYFGAQTQKAVKAYQTAKGIPSTGFVGPLTRGALNGSPVVAGSMTCPVGYTCTANPGSPVAPVTTLDNADGSLTVSLNSFASNVSIKKGETKDVVAIKAQATAGNVAVTRFDIRMDKRPWLYFSKLVLKDSTGVVIATKNLSASTDATEITVGTDYLVRFDGISAVVVPGTDRIFVVSATALSTTDKLSSDVDVNVSVPSSSIRTVNGKGFTDSLGLSGTNFTAGTTGRLVTLTGTGSTGNVLARVSPTTPAQRIQTTSTNGETTGVILGSFDFKSENSDSTINSLIFTLKNSNSVGFSTMYKRVYLAVGGSTYQVDSVGTTSTFSNLNIALPRDQWITATLKADVADQDDFTNGTVASTTMTVNTTNIVGIDANYNTVTASAANTITSNDVTFLQSGASVSNLLATAELNDNGTSRATGATIGFQFTFNNTGNTDLYISTVSNTALATSSTLTTANSSTTLKDTLTVTSPSTVAGDLAGSYYIIPSNTSRTFKYTGTMDNTNGVQAPQSAKITKIYFDDDTTGLQEFNINFGLEALQTPPKSF